ncbi:MAG: hypothetical protein QHC90_25235 [Shinella sp.]|nr:hypothetical protein [Shinella sp.]
MMTTRQTRAGACGALGALFAVGAIAIFAAQTFLCLQAGEWPSMSVIDLIKLFATPPWLEKPDAWIGLYEIVDAIPITFICMIAAYIAVASEKAASE